MLRGAKEGGVPPEDEGLPGLAMRALFGLKEHCISLLTALYFLAVTLDESLCSSESPFACL